LEEQIEQPTRQIHPEDLPRVMEKWLVDMASGQPSEDEMRLRGADGEYRWFLVRTVPLRDEQGNIVKWYGSSIDIEARKQAEKELLRLSGQLLRSQDEERRRIARELHDSTGQNLVALATMLGQLSRSFPLVKEKSRTLLSQCQEVADLCIREVRTFSYLLHPPELDEAGLEDAIRDYANGFTKRSGIRVELELSTRLGRMARDIELAVFRVVQESLTNIQRHSGSQEAKIRIDRNTNLTLEISDRGHGALGNSPRGEHVSTFGVGVGILSMRERVKSIGGRLDIDSTAHGTTVRVTVPLGREEREKTAHSNC
jgi:signal transduction histidine kinase